MKRIRFAGICNTGLHRKNNQDNFWCNGAMLPLLNQGTADTLQGEWAVQDNPCVAVFDGMGGAACGEIAAYLAAETLNDLRKLDAAELYHSMNDRICKYAKEHRVSQMGTTAAMLDFSEDYVTVSNIGDSKIYGISKGKLEQISEDHTCLFNGLCKKPPLSQCLGIEEEEFVIEPYIQREPIESYDMYLLCSDGITDMLTESDLEKVLSEDRPEADLVEKIETMVLERGAKDNFTAFILKMTM